MSNLDPDAAATESMQLYEGVRLIFAGRDPEVIGATLAQLMAVLLVGHIANTRKATDQLREDLLDQWIETVLKLIPPTEAEMRERHNG